MITKNILQTIKYYSQFVDWEISFSGKSRGNNHLERVSKIAIYLAKKNNAKLDIVEAGAFLHDIGLSKGNDDNPLLIREIANDFLITLAISEKDRLQILNCVESHEGNMPAKTLEAMIIHDADVLDKSGMLGVIRHTWKIVNLIDVNATDEEIYFILKKHLFWRESMLYTDEAKMLGKSLFHNLGYFLKNKENSLTIINQIRIFAKKGLITEQIANKLSKNKNLDKKMIELINLQLNCQFLEIN